MEELKKEIEALRVRVEEKEHDLLLIQQELNILKAKLDDAIAEKRVEDLKQEEEDRIRDLAQKQAEEARQEAKKKEAEKEESHQIEQAQPTQEVEASEADELISEPTPQVEEAQHEAIMRTIDELSKDLGMAGSARNFEAKPTLGDRVSKRKLNDIKRGIGINERFLFANELFNGDMSAFSQAVDELNHVDSETDANRLLDENLGLKYSWDGEDETVIAFKSLVSRRFS